MDGLSNGFAKIATRTLGGGFWLEKNLPWVGQDRNLRGKSE